VRILVVDDEPSMAAAVERGLRDDGHEVAVAHDGIAALRLVGEADPEAAVVDVAMPGMSGFELARRIKESAPAIMVILLTARDAVDDRVRGLDAGADDYLTKPFHLAELCARLRAVQRRGALQSPTALTVGPLRLDLTRSRAHADGREVRLSRTEFDVLRVLAERAGEPVSREELLRAVWDTTQHIDGNVVDQYLSYLRRKLAQHAIGVRITTRRGVGFTLAIEEP
jgi:two-component system, OmpR family, response regulator